MNLETQKLRNSGTARRAFTMIELIVVIGIIGILMAVLIGTFGGSTESARAAKCMSNMRNLAMAAQSVGMETAYYPYAGSFDKYEGTGSDRKTVQARGWIGWSAKGPGGKYISPYETDLTLREFSITNGTIWASMRGARESYVCPGHVQQQQKAKSAAGPLWSYAMNAYFGLASRSKPRYHDHHGKGYRSFRRPDRHLLFAELPYAAVKDGAVEQTGQLSGVASDPVLQYSGCEGGGNEAIGFNHKDGKYSIAHVCFADGHVEKLRAPKSGDVKELTKWLCRPVDDKGQDFDISFDGKKYQKVQ